MQSRRVDEAQSVAAGDVVRTTADPGSIAEVVHRNGAVTRLDASSEAVVDLLDREDRPRIILTLGEGRTWHHTGVLDDATIYEARCPSGIATARWAVFTVDCKADGSVDIAAVRGNVVVRGQASGSVALSDRQWVRIAPDGTLGPVAPAAQLDDDEWVAVNTLLDRGPRPSVQAVPEPGAEVDTADSVADADPVANADPVAQAGPVAQADPVVVADPEPVAAAAPAPAARTFPRWASWTAGIAASLAFILLLAATFVAAQDGDRAAGHATASAKQTDADVVLTPPVAPLPAGAAALIRAAQDRRVAPETTTPTTAEPEPPAVIRFGPRPEAAPSTTVPAPVPTAQATATSCARQGSSLVLSGVIANTGPVASRFAVDTVFRNGSGTRFASATATVASLAPHRSASWSVAVAAPRSTAGMSCDVAGVRPV
jgi:hypothetical protein